MIEALQFEFMRNALAGALLASVACGMIGTFVVVKRIGYISGGIAHAAFGGIGLGYWLGINPLLSLVPFSLASALGIGIVSKKGKVAEDTAIGILWAMGMAIGILFIGFTPGYVPDLFSYLFGNILTVTRNDIYFIIALDLVIMLIVFALYKEFLALAFDEEYAEVSGVKTMFIYLLLLCLIAVTIVMLVRVVGIILVIALLTIPAAIAKQYTRSLGKMMFLAVFTSAVLTVGGLWFSYEFNIASGATIILLSGAAFAVSSLWKYFTHSSF